MVRAKKQYKFEPDYAVLPGETLKEVMDSLSMKQNELALRTGLTVQSINRILKGDQPITYETANKLELATDVPAHFWNNLEIQYREQLAKIQEQKQLEADINWLKRIPVKELIERGVIEPQKDELMLLKEVLKFYGVSSVSAWKGIWESPAVAARRSECFETRVEAAATWIRLGELKAHEIQCQPFNKSKFKKVVSHIRGLIKEKPGHFTREMIERCAEAGVAIAFVPEMKKVPWQGATKWLSASKAMILLNIRYKREDIFWFSFFHETGHVLHDEKKYLYINDGTNDDPKERRANEFAAETLIPRKWDKQIKRIRSKAEITQLAKDLDLPPGIVAGRFQHLTGKWNYFNGLIRKFEWA
ncbi:MAG: helix-turn-helix domain-containing protein [Desulfobacterales bacterium]